MEIVDFAISAVFALLIAYVALRTTAPGKVARHFQKIADARKGKAPE